MENFSSAENGIFSRELQNIRAEVADCENQIAILTESYNFSRSILLTKAACKELKINRLY